MTCNLVSTCLHIFFIIKLVNTVSWRTTTCKLIVFRPWLSLSHVHGLRLFRHAVLLQHTQPALHPISCRRIHDIHPQQPRMYFPQVFLWASWLFQVISWLENAIFNTRNSPLTIPRHEPAFRRRAAWGFCLFF